MRLVSFRVWSFSVIEASRRNVTERDLHCLARSPECIRQEHIACENGGFVLRSFACVNIGFASVARRVNQKLRLDPRD